MSKGKPPRAVVDTNLFVSGIILKRGNPYALLEAWRKGAFLLLVSETLQEEIERILQRPKFSRKYGLSAEEIATLIGLVATKSLPVSPRRRLPIKVRDVNDEMVLATALGGKADYLITGDEDLLVLRSDKRLGALKIVTAKEFLGVLHSLE